MAIQFVNSATTNANPGASATATITTTAGNDVIACIILNSGTATVTSVTDTGNSNYVQRASIVNGANTTFLWSARNVVASTSVTVNVSPNQKIVMVVLQYSGVAALGLTATNSGTNTGPTVSLTTQDNNNFVVAALGDHGIPTITANAGNLRAQRNVSTEANGISMAGVDNTSATPASVTCSDTLSVSEVWMAVALELRTVAPAVAAFPTVLAMCGVGQ